MSNFEQALRMQHVQPSPVRKVLDKARQMQRVGRSVVHLEIGEPDFDTPPNIIKEAEACMQSGLTHYTPNRGIPEFLSAICDDINAKCGISYNPSEEVIVTVGVAEALFDSIFAYINPGDEVIGFTPSFMNYNTDVSVCGGVFVPVPLKQENDFQADCKLLESKITDKTKMLILCNPCNPSGAVLDGNSLSQIADIAIRHDLIVISDEIYDRVVYGETKPISIAALPGMKERTIMLNGFSKVYAMTGWRVGYLAADQALISPILRVHQYLTTCLPAFTQKAVAACMKDRETQACVEKMVATFKQRRDFIVDRLNEMPRVSFVVPQGAFYLLLNVSGTGLDGESFATRLLDKYGVATIPAKAFGEDYGDYIRISYATSMEDLAEGMRRMSEFINSI